MATVSQEQIEDLITSIWHAQLDRSVTNIMVARVLDWLRSRADELEALIRQGETEHKKELEAVYAQIARLSEKLRGVNTIATAAHGRADTNARNIQLLESRVKAIVDYLIDAGQLPLGWEWGSGQQPTIAPEHVDRGAWNAGTTYYAEALNETTGMVETSHVWYMGCKFRCLVTGTSDAPRWNSPDWEFEEGDPEAHLVFMGSDDSLIAAGETKNIGCRVVIYNQDATADVAEWEITRDTGSETEDTAWSLKEKVQDFDGDIDIACTATENDLGYEGKASFLVTARLQAGPEVKGILEI